MSGAWARQLRKEFEEICWSYGIQLEPCVIEISNVKGRYGSWNQELGTIEISAELIRNFSWDVVLNVLKHEMAHQICSEIFGVPKGSHGKIFHEACEMIGLDPRFRTSSGDLPEGVTDHRNVGSQTLESRRFIERIRKLLALAQSANEHEANLAMAKARQLMDKYNLRMAELENTDGYVHVIINHKKKRLERHNRKICLILKKFFYVYVVLSSQYDPYEDTEHKVIDLMGRKENVEVAEYVYFFLLRKIRSLWEENRKKLNGKGIRARNSYYEGLLRGLYDKLEKQNCPTAGPPSGRHASGGKTTSELVLASDAELKRFVNSRYPHLHTYSSRRPKINMDCFAKGLAHGKKIVIQRAVHNHQGNKGLALKK
ncbi:MAG: hypothetical protein DSZ23_03195 [Thermodesulfatator sp.]|nr:MAG: hypothetical protein DSZ23_03195 [Thermodesulfatator sp.]